MINRWSIWGFIITRIAKAQGFIDPRMLFSQIQRFSRPSEVWVPAELLRSGMVLQARGLLNSQAIQNNLDWVWPFWVNRQFDPSDVAFIPRAFNLTHINLSHRNWTGLGLPDYSDYAIVDPCGLVTPILDGWSIDAWIVRENGPALIPAQLPGVYQQIQVDGNVRVITYSDLHGKSLQACAEVTLEGGVPTCRVTYTGLSESRAWLMVCVRPYNPEGISLIEDIERLPSGDGWNINNKSEVHLKQVPWHYVFANYQTGDILRQVASLTNARISYEDKHVRCPVGMATAAAVYELQPHQPNTVVVDVPLIKTPLPEGAVTAWAEHLETGCAITIPDTHMQSLFETALRTLVLYAPEDVYPGPYTYKRFWFRDAAFIIYAMAAVGLTRNLGKILGFFPKRQTPLGYFESQDGEWDSNGQAMWAVERVASMTGTHVPKDLLSSIERGAGWIKRKRVSGKVQSGHMGLLPAGFSAEHFGPSDFYYWDDFWSVAGLQSAVKLLSDTHPEAAQAFEHEALDLQKSIENSLNSVDEHLEPKGIPASPYRRMDAGAIGSMVASYPLQLYAADDERVLTTAHFLMRKYFLNGAYYHELSHSGINIYLTLHLAQVLLRAGDPRFFSMVTRVAELATPTGQWPEAIHPQTKGGCMGDGQHVWAVAEWVMMLRNMFVREEEDQRALILCSGIPAAWLQKKQDMSFGPTNTIFGPVSVRIEVGDSVRVIWDAQWRRTPARIEVRLNGQMPYIVPDDNVHSVEFLLHEKVSG